MFCSAKPFILAVGPAQLPVSMGNRVFVPVTNRPGYEVEHSHLARWILRLSGVLPLLPPICFLDMGRDNVLVI
jgi:hypothetical protein